MKNLKLLTILMFSQSSLAAVVNVTAEYKPEVYDAINGGRFINTTPCDVGVALDRPFCDPNKPLESSVVVKLPVSISKKINSSLGKRYYLNYYRMSGPKKITLTNKINGETHVLDFIPTHVGAKVSGMDYPLIGTDKWPMSNIGGDCTPKAFTSYGWQVGNKVIAQLFLHAIKNSSQNGVSECYFNSMLGDGTTYNVEWLNYGFRMKAPNPLAMSNGTYTGSVRVSVGPNQDIDLGDGTYSGGTEHELRFSLAVRHQIKVDFPKGEREGHSSVSLLPPGGWSDWIYNRKNAPEILQRDLPFRISASANMHVWLRCQYRALNACGLKNERLKVVPLKTFYVGEANKTYELSLVQTTLSFNSLYNAPRYIRFQVVGDSVREMMKYPGTTFKGDVTLIFDASL